MEKSTIYIDKNFSDVIKICAAVMIALHHFSQYVCVNHISDNLFYSMLSSQGGYLGVAVFFFISGYGLMESEQRVHLGCVDFFKRRLAKVYLPALAVTAIWLSLINFTNILPAMRSTLGGGGNFLIIIKILAIQGDGILWFIKVLVVWYAAFYLFVIVWQRWKQFATPFLFLLTIVVELFVIWYFASYNALSVPMFALGVYTSLHKEVVDWKVKSPLVVVIIVGCLQTLLMHTMCGTASGIHTCCNFIFVAAMIYLFSIAEIRMTRVPLIGAISFDLYLVHNKVLMTLKTMMFPVPLYLFALTTIIATIIFHLIRTKIFRI